MEVDLLKLFPAALWNILTAISLLHYYFSDEASSALDTETEQDLLKRLRHLLESDDNNLSAVLFMTHKADVMNACDRVAVLADGTLLIEKDKTY